MFVSTAQKILVQFVPLWIHWEYYRIIRFFILHVITWLYMWHYYAYAAK